MAPATHSNKIPEFQLPTRSRLRPRYASRSQTPCPQLVPSQQGHPAHTHEEAACRDHAHHHNHLLPHGSVPSTTTGPTAPAGTDSLPPPSGGHCPCASSIQLGLLASSVHPPGRAVSPQAPIFSGCVGRVTQRRLGRASQDPAPLPGLYPQQLRPQDSPGPGMLLRTGAAFWTRNGKTTDEPRRAHSGDRTAALSTVSPPQCPCAGKSGREKC